MLPDSIVAIVFVLFTILGIALRLEKMLAKLVMLAGILLLILVTLAFAMGNEELAKRLANYAYFSLVSGVLLLFIEQVPWLQKKLPSKKKVRICLCSFLRYILSIFHSLLMPFIERIFRAQKKLALKMKIASEYHLFTRYIFAFSFVSCLHRIRKKLTTKKGWIPYFIYSILALAILSPLLAPGYILSLDMIFAPNMDFKSQLYGLHDIHNSTAPLHFLIQIISKLIPTWVLQKIIFFMIFFLAGLGTHKLCPTREGGKYFAGLLYVINPFVYVRFLVGQWGLLFAYALIPFAVKAFIDMLDENSWSKAMKVAVLTTLVGIVMVQGYLLLFLVYLIVLIFKIIRERRQLTFITSLSKCLVVCTVVLIGLNIYWIIPSFSIIGELESGIGGADLLEFAPKAISNLGVPFEVAAMQGFWRPEPYLWAKDFFRFWFLLPVFLIGLAFCGFLIKCRNRDIGWLVLSTGVIGIVSYILALGTASNITKLPFEWLFYNFPFFKAFRDSQKFIALLCFSYAYLGGLGVGYFIDGIASKKRWIVQTGFTFLVIFSFILPLLFSFIMFGLHGQVKPTDYPKEWYEVNEFFNQDTDDFNVLFLPWHLYMDYNWVPNNNKKLANPAWKFFNKPVIAGDNIELENVYSQSTDPISNYIDFLLAHSGEIINLGELLAPLNVKYILLVNEVDYDRYDFLYRQDDLVVELKREGYTLFRNNNKTAKAYGVDSVIYIDSLEEYLQLSKKQNVTEHLYIIGEGENSRLSSAFSKIELEVIRPVKYETTGNGSKYIIFTVPQNISTEQWRYNGQHSLKNLGFMPAFSSSADAGKIVYTKFYNKYLPSYIISLFTLASMLWFYFWCSKRVGK